MVEIFRSKAYPIMGENNTLEGSESVIVYDFDNIEESEEFDTLSNSEKLMELGLKEDNTPSTKHAELKRYFIDNSENLIIVKEITIVY